MVAVVEVQEVHFLASSLQVHNVAQGRIAAKAKEASQVRVTRRRMSSPPKGAAKSTLSCKRAYKLRKGFLSCKKASIGAQACTANQELAATQVRVATQVQVVA